MNQKYKQSKYRKEIEYEVFELITANQMKVEKVQIIGNDLIMGFSKSQQLMRIWSISKRQALYEVTFDQLSITQPILFEDQQDLISFALSDKVALVQRIQNFQGIFRTQEAQFEGKIKATKLSKDRKSIVISIGEIDSNIRLLSDSCVKSLFENATLEVIDFCIYQDFAYIAIITSQGIISVYLLSKQYLINRWKAHHQGKKQQIHYFKKILFSEGQEFKIKMWNAKNYSLIRVLDQTKMFLSSLDSVKYYIIMAAYTPSLDIFSFVSGQLIQSLDLDYLIIQIDIDEKGSLLAALDENSQIILLRERRVYL